MILYVVDPLTLYCMIYYGGTKPIFWDVFCGPDYENKNNKMRKFWVFNNLCAIFSKFMDDFLHKYFILWHEICLILLKCCISTKKLRNYCIYLVYLLNIAKKWNQPKCRKPLFPHTRYNFCQNQSYFPFINPFFHTKRKKIDPLTSKSVFNWRFSMLSVEKFGKT